MTHGSWLMELLLEVRWAGAPRGLDIVVDIDPDRSVAALADALAQHVGDRLPRDVAAAPVLRRRGRPEPLNPGMPVGAAGLASGDTVVLGAATGTAVAGERVRRARSIRPGEVIQAGSSGFTLRVVTAGGRCRPDRLGQVPLNRVPYRPTVVTPHRFDALSAPPTAVRPRSLSLATCLLPAVSAAVLATITARWYLLGLAALAPLLVAWRWASQRRDGHRGFGRERAAFLTRVERRAGEVDRALEAERRQRLAAAPDLASLGRRAAFHLPRLWERNRSVGDVLALRLGLGQLASQVSAPIERGGDDALQAEAQARLAHQSVVRAVPVILDVVDLGVVGLCGDAPAAQVVTAGLVAQAACLHSPEDLVMAAAVGPRQVGTFEWLKWLPHVRSPTSPLEGGHLVVGADATRRLLVHLLDVVGDRRRRSGAAGGEAAVWPRLLVVVSQAADPDRRLLSQLLDGAAPLGVHVLWAGGGGREVPRQCRAVVWCPGDRGPARLRYTDPRRPGQLVALDRVARTTVEAIARSLAPVRDAGATSPTGAIPRVVALFDVLGTTRPTPEVIAARWEAARDEAARDAADRLEAVIGEAGDGPLAIDLVEHGPHTLIGGTSGAGKSELLQTLVLSLAARYPPDRLSFLFVDYKGGASSAELRDLPHAVGCVTNLDARLGQRALTSLRAELQERMRLLEGRAKDLAGLARVAPAETPPRLVIVIDELAALVSEVPEFVAGIVDLAQRGRSLGLHLVLATQRPAGVVNEAILANTNLRIALRVLDPGDSTSIIGARDAADIPVPLRGRAYARTGPQSLVAFQCAWSGAPAGGPRTADTVVVRALRFGADDGPAAARRPQPAGRAGSGRVAGGGAGAGGSRPGAADSGRARPGGRGSSECEPSASQLDAVVEACAGAARVLRVRPARRPWFEPLAEVVSLEDVLAAAPVADVCRNPGRFAVLGLADEPARQAQPPAIVDLESSGGLLVFGTGGSGKTTLLRTVAAAAAAHGAADQVQIHALDFAGRGLGMLAELPQCAAVVAGDDAERVTRLLTLLDHEIDRRRRILAGARADSLASLLAVTGARAAGLPRIVVLLDGYGGFHNAFDRADGHRWIVRLQHLVSAGRGVGVHFVITAERRLGVPAALLSAMSARMALRLATAEELVALGVPARLARDAELPAGRGFLGGTTEVQVACAGGEPAAPAQAAALAARAASAAAATGARAPALPELPTSLTLETRPGRPLTAPIGLADLSLETVRVDLARHHLVVAGPPLSGRSTALETVAAGLRAASGPGLHLAALGAATSPLARLTLWDDAAFSRAAHARLVERLSARLAGDEAVEARVVLLVDAAEDVDGSEIGRPLEALLHHDALRVAVACETATVAKAYGGWLAGARRSRNALVLQPESPGEVEAAVGVRPALRPGQALPPGRGLLVLRGHATLLQVGHSAPPAGP